MEGVLFAIGAKPRSRPGQPGVEGASTKRRGRSKKQGRGAEQVTKKDSNWTQKTVARLHKKNSTSASRRELVLDVVRKKGGCCEFLKGETCRLGKKHDPRTTDQLNLLNQRTECGGKSATEQIPMS